MISFSVLPNRLGEVLANVKELHTGKTVFILQLFINVKYWWVKRQSPDSPWDLFLLKHFLVFSNPSPPPWVDAFLRSLFWVKILWNNPRSIILPKAPFPVYNVGMSAFERTHHLNGLWPSRLHMSHLVFCALTAFSFSLAVSKVFLTIWEICQGCYSSQLPLLRLLKHLLSQLVLALAINWESCPLLKARH